MEEVHGFPALKIFRKRGTQRSVKPEIVVNFGFKRDPKIPPAKSVRFRNPF